MFLFILATLIIGSVHTLTIGYPVQTASTTHGDIPTQGSIVQGFIRYLDNNGVERVISYIYPKPVASQVAYAAGSLTPYVHTYVTTQSLALPQPNYVALEKAREAHFRAWSWQQYQALKREIDILRSDGKEPSTDMLAKYQPLEKVALATDYTTIAEMPDIKRLRNEHYKIWQQSTLKDVPKEQSSQYVPTSVKELSQQKHIHEEHLRIYNEQIEKLKQLENQNIHEKVVQQQEQQKLHGTQVGGVTQENSHLRTEVKAHAGEIGGVSQAQGVLLDTRSGDFEHSKQQQQQQQQQQQHVVSQKPYHPDVKAIKPIVGEHIAPGVIVKASSDQHSVDKGKLLTSVSEQHEQQQQHHHHHHHDEQSQQNTQNVQDSQAVQADRHYKHTAHIGFTPEVERARQEHLKIFNEIKSHVEHKQQEQKLQMELQQQQQREQHLMEVNREEYLDRLREAERKQEEEHFLQLESIREAQRLQEQQIQLELDKQREAERLAEEQRQMEAELMGLRLDEASRMQLERLKEAKYLKQDEEQIKQQIIMEKENEEISRAIVGPSPQDHLFNIKSFEPQQQQQYIYSHIPPFASTPLYTQSTPTGVFPASVSYLKTSDLVQPNTYLVAGQQQKPAYYIVPVGGDRGASGVVGPIQYVPYVSQGKSFQIPIQQTVAKVEQSPRGHAHSTAKDLDELAKARREHFEAYNKALKQLSVTAGGRSGTIAPC